MKFLNLKKKKEIHVKFRDKKNNLAKKNLIE